MMAARGPPTEKLARKDVWRLRPGGQVQFQVQFGEYGGSYVQHCHRLWSGIERIRSQKLIPLGADFARATGSHARPT